MNTTHATIQADMAANGSVTTKVTGNQEQVEALAWAIAVKSNESDAN